jgi:hypothetical protein
MKRSSMSWPDVGLISVFWVYVAMTNLLWGICMQASLVSTGAANVFAPWDARLLQHLLLYPVLVANLGLSRRIGWQPAWRGIPLQAGLAIAFAVLASPAMELAEGLTGLSSWKELRTSGLWPGDDMYPGIRALSWLASATLFTLPYLFSVALLAGTDMFRRYRDAQLHAAALQRSLSAAHLAALRMQLSPHTLFNLLHTIRGHVEWDPGLARSMIVQLGDLLRWVLRAGEHELNQLRDELRFVHLYLELQQTRFVDRLNVASPAPEPMPAVWVPTLILQPLVENAVIHGLADPQAALTVSVEVEVDGEDLMLRVVNSYTPGFVDDGATHSGIGLRNVRERLAIQFGPRAALTAGPGSSNEWVAVIRMPLLHDAA